ncbi:uncharacterized protein LOC124442935 [Xenia sp. Carnegie-2017]|uniref:uncharacterized protein LOC124442935 n=1 Tax=Xenia sp. Carnegie-2017 TaxID=2897299 RepID=UPI001F038199|nr:uncharacterized protein LOC124442935 [Xenia sp. Carnegie-2017]
MADWQEILIELVRERRCLWDKFHPDYKDTRNIKKNNWKDVAREMKVATNIDHSDEDVKKKWANLRDTFHQQRRSYEAKLASGAPAVEEPVWKWWKCFQWLHDVTKQNTSSSFSNLPEIEPRVSSPCSHESDQTSSQYIAETDDMEDQEETSSVSACNSTCNSTFTPKRSSKRKRSNAERENALLLKELASVNSELSSMSQMDPNDDLHYFAMSIAGKMRKMSECQQAVARKEIENILFQIQFAPSQTHGPNFTYSQPTTVTNTTDQTIQSVAPDNALTDINLG